MVKRACKRILKSGTKAQAFHREVEIQLAKKQGLNAVTKIIMFKRSGCAYAKDPPTT